MLLATHPLPPAHPTYVHPPAPLHTPQQRLQFEAFEALSSPSNPELAFVSIEDKQLATQLAHLASQHHASEYNRMKFGPRGAPLTYIPLSLQLPGHVRELQTRQVTNARKQAWWPCDRKAQNLDRPTSSKRLYPTETLPAVPASFTPPVMAPSSVDLQQELSAAIASSLPTHLPNPLHQTKTSKTHPINVSLIIPIELLPIISTHLVAAPTPYPVMFHLPACYFLDRVTAAPSGSSQFSVHIPSNDRLPPAPINVIRPMRAHTYAPPILWSQPRGGDALQAAINGSDISKPPGMTASASPIIEDTAPSPLVVHEPPPLAIRPPPVSGDVLPAPCPVESLTQIPPTGVTRRPLRPKRASSAPPVLSLFKPMHAKPSRIDIKPFLRHSFPIASRAVATTNVFAHKQSSSVSALPCTIPPAIKSSVPSFPKADVITLGAPKLSTLLSSFAPTGSAAATPPARPVLGNLFLSSCPGKKVRLTGPVKGRGAICRDLASDLGRMKELGVGCIICCLDDEELDFLGATWSEYLRVAHSLGLDVLRLPTPEGLTPLNPESLDDHLSQVITSYTLRGVPILVHCRGGVGRAGLVACCWLLKLGLCGWKNPGLSRPRSSNAEVCHATQQLVERVINVVRRRRSLKAVETYEQVKFLVDYVEYLDRKQGMQTTGGDVD